MYFEDINIELLDNVDQRLREPLRQVLICMKNANSIYSKKNIEKIVNDLKSKNLKIKTEKVITSSDNVANDIDRQIHSYGYIDFGIDSIMYNNRCDKKIIMWEETVSSCDSRVLTKALAFLIEEYISKDEEKIFQSYKILENAIKKNRNFEYTMLTDFGGNKLPNIGGFRKSILDKWCSYIDYASSDLISSFVTNYNNIFKKISKFLKTLLKIGKSSISELVINKRKNNFEYVFSIIPEEYVKKISLFAIIMENSDSYTKYLIFKYKTEIEIYRYISYLFYENVFNTFDENEKYCIIELLLNVSNTLYNPNIKFDCGLI